MRIFPPFLWHSIGLGSFLMNINMNLNSQGAREWLTGLDWLTDWLTGWQNDWLPGQVHIRWPGNYLQQQQSLNAEWSECASNEPRGAEGQRGNPTCVRFTPYTLNIPRWDPSTYPPIQFFDITLTVVSLFYYSLLIWTDIEYAAGDNRWQSVGTFGRALLKRGGGVGTRPLQPSVISTSIM